MRKLILSAVIFLFALSSCYSQQLEVKYKCHNKKKFEEAFPSAPKEQVMKVAKYINDYHLVFLLVQDNQQSVFKLLDEIVDRKALKENGSDFYLPQRDDVFYKNFGINKLEALKNHNFKSHKIKDKIPDYCWKITTEYKMILGYRCFKAVLEDDHLPNTIAWFTPEIPVSNGPIEFNGLPGLILEVEQNLIYQAVEIKMNEIDKQLLPLDSLGFSNKAISLDAFYRAM